MEDVITNKIQQLAKEASDLGNMRIGLQQQLGEINTRLTQISGALVELQKVQKELKGDSIEDSSNNKP